MRTSEIVIQDHIPPSDADIIESGLNRYNDDIAGYADRQTLAVLARDLVNGEVFGGA